MCTHVCTNTRRQVSRLYKLSIEYSGTVREQITGFYRSKYTHADGSVGYTAVTQFEPADARRAFPCWDEPDFKASFDVTIVAPRDRVVLSNMVRAYPSGVNAGPLLVK